MLETMPTKVFKGTWPEVLSHQDEIPAGSIVELSVYEPSVAEEDTEAYGGKTAAEIFEAEIGTVSFEPSDLGERAEEYLSPGFGTTNQNSKS